LYTGNRPRSSDPGGVVFERTFITRRGFAWNFVSKLRGGPQLRPKVLPPRLRRILIGLCGVWLMIAAVWRWSPGVQLWSNLVVGTVTIVGGFSIAKYYQRSGIASQTLGIWITAAAFIPALLSGEPLVANNIVVGMLLMLAGFSVRGARAHPS